MTSRRTEQPQIDIRIPSLILMFLLASSLQGLAQSFTHVTYRANSSTGVALAPDQNLLLSGARLGGLATGQLYQSAQTPILREATPTTTLINQVQLYENASGTTTAGITVGTSWGFPPAGATPFPLTCDLDLIHGFDWDGDGYGDLMGRVIEYDGSNTFHSLAAYLGGPNGPTSYWAPNLLQDLIHTTSTSAQIGPTIDAWAVTKWNHVQFVTPPTTDPKRANLWATISGSYLTVGKGLPANLGGGLSTPNSFTLPATGGVGSAPHYLVFKDVDGGLPGGDQYVELIITLPGAVHVLMNPEIVADNPVATPIIGSYSLTTAYHSGALPQVIDYDGDALTDLIVQGPPVTAFLTRYDVFEFSGASISLLATLYLPSGYIQDFRCLDADLDGDLDFFTLETSPLATGQYLRLLTNTGSGYVGTSITPSFPLTAPGIVGFEVGYIDQDALPDVLYLDGTDLSVFKIAYRDNGQVQSYPGTPAASGQFVDLWSATPAIDGYAISTGPFHRLKHIKPLETVGIQVTTHDGTVLPSGSLLELYVEVYPTTAFSQSPIGVGPPTYAWLSPATYGAGPAWSSTSPGTNTPVTILSGVGAGTSGFTFLLQARAFSFNTLQWYYTEMHEFQIE